ncbi:hypothetical protein OUZ56_027349 [Daphnia magna]|uniref:Mitochondrial fission process protein 1 n=1 Tax=Daphnia magna TaxID=35525 RepID=A0ABQ9ZPH9_9CRUS|nr:hypothetical protein OUZ56_027349 [Daphnia magna]
MEEGNNTGPDGASGTPNTSTSVCMVRLLPQISYYFCRSFSYGRKRNDSMRNESRTNLYGFDPSCSRYQQYQIIGWIRYIGYVSNMEDFKTGFLFRRVKGNFLPLGIALVIFNPVERDYNKLGFEFGLRWLAQYQFSRPSIKKPAASKALSYALRKTV